MACVIPLIEKRLNELKLESELLHTKLRLMKARDGTYMGLCREVYKQVSESVAKTQTLKDILAVYVPGEIIQARVLESEPEPRSKPKPKPTSTLKRKPDPESKKASTKKSKKSKKSKKPKKLVSTAESVVSRILAGEDSDIEWPMENH